MVSVNIYKERERETKRDDDDDDAGLYLIFVLEP